MDVSNIRKILDSYNKGASNILMLDETKDILDILYNKKLIDISNDGNIKKLNHEKVYIGKLQKNEGFGFVVVEGVADFYVRNVSEYMDKDEVLIITTQIKGKNTTANILEVINRGNEYLLVKMQKNNKLKVLNSNSISKVMIKGLDYEQIKPGTILSVNVIKVKNGKVITTLNNIIADENDPDLDMKIVLDKYNIKVEFSDGIEKELGKVEDEILEGSLENRKDLRDQYFFTIDGSDSKDLDDAISLVKNENGYILYVAIADVSEYIKDGTKLDEAAKDRATSVYFIDRVVPMLPKKISNGICSLHAGVDRLTMVCEMHIDKQINIKKINIYEAVINSKYRMTYSDVNDMLIRNDKDLISKYGDIYGILIEMNKLAKKLNAIRIARGSFNLEDTDAKFKLDENQKIVDIYHYHREDGEKLIEEFMILANECVTKFAKQHSSPFIYRVHGSPNPNKLKALKDYLVHLNIPIKFDEDNLDPHDFKEILDSIEDDIIKRAVSKTIVRSMQKAIYSTENIGHFGLASQNYTHFTSPIRRYPDLEVHRILKGIILNEKLLNMGELAYVSEHCSKKEVSAIKAEQEIEDKKKAEYMKQFVGETFIGRVTGIEDYGIFVELENTIRGLIPFRFLNNYKSHDLYTVKFFVENDLNFGQEVEVEVFNVNIQRGLIDFFPKGYVKKEFPSKDHKANIKKGSKKKVDRSKNSDENYFKKKKSKYKRRHK